MRIHWSKLPPVRYGFSRVPDEVGTGRRLLQCDACKQIIPSLGVGYHLGNRDARPCTERPPLKNQPIPAWPKRITAGPEYGPPAPTAELLARLAYEAHALVSVAECDAATTAAGCIWHPAPMAAHRPGIYS